MLQKPVTTVDQPSTGQDRSPSVVTRTHVLKQVVAPVMHSIYYDFCSGTFLLFFCVSFFHDERLLCTSPRQVLVYIDLLMTNTINHSNF